MDLICPINQKECTQNQCGFSFWYPERTNLCVFQALAIILYNIEKHLGNIEELLQNK